MLIFCRFMLAYATAENSYNRLKNYKGRFQERAEKDLQVERVTIRPADDSVTIRNLRRPDFNPYDRPKISAEADMH